MSDSVKKWHEMEEDKKLSNPKAMYVFVLDFTYGKVYRYKVVTSYTGRDEWDPGTESCESFLHNAGHEVNNCQWMLTNKKDPIELKTWEVNKINTTST